MNNRVAWVTGGGTGIGRALAEALCREGFSVAITGRRKDVLSRAAQEIAVLKGPGEIWALPGDASEAGPVEEIVRSLREKWGDVELLINNAGANTYHSFEEADPVEFEQLFRINCLSAVLCAKAVLPSMLANRRGAIVNVSSILGKWASPDSAAYSVSKFALAGLTDVLRQELSGAGIHVLGVYPGLITTPMTEPLMNKRASLRRFQAFPQAMAETILRGLKRKQREVLYPWYVPWAVRLHQWAPGLLEKLR